MSTAYAGVVRKPGRVGHRQDAAGRGGRARRATVLVVSEDPALRRQIGSMLREQGYDVLDARHGGQALLACLSHRAPIDLVITEERTPETDGRRLARTLSQVRPRLKMLLLSAQSQVVETQHLQHQSGILQQPFTAATLGAEVEAVLRADRLTDS